MTNAAVRANGRTLPEATSRGAIFGLLLTAGAVAVIPAAASGAAAPTLTAIDRRVLDLWSQRAKLKAIAERLSEQYAAAKSQLPEWAKAGPKYLRPDGSPSGRPSERSWGWPAVSDLNRRPVDLLGFITARPSPEDLRNEWEDALWHGASRADADLELERSLAEFSERVRQQKAEGARVGTDVLGKRSDAAQNAVCAVETKLDELIGASVLALGGVLVMEISAGREDAEDIPGLYRAALAAIRPQLVGAIAEDADRVLAAGV